MKEPLRPRAQCFGKCTGARCRPRAAASTALRGTPGGYPPAQVQPVCPAPQSEKLGAKQVSPEQHPEAAVHAWPAPEQVAPAQTPLRQLRPLQQSPVVVHTPVSGWHEMAEHRRVPVPSGRQGSPLQHWLANWHALPLAMQQGAWPV